VFLDEVDRELERRGHPFVRYADDTNVYVRSHRACKRLTALLLRLYGRLRLTVNRAKGAVASVCKTTLIHKVSELLRCNLAQPLALRYGTVPAQVPGRELTRRSGGRSFPEAQQPQTPPPIQPCPAPNATRGVCRLPLPSRRHTPRKSNIRQRYFKVPSLRGGAPV
jgi:RNA-directed DNA polymerase